MEPGSLDPGDVAAMVAGIRWAYELQWSQDHLILETQTAKARGDYDDLLQWSQDHLILETSGDS